MTTREQLVNAKAKLMRAIIDDLASNSDVWRRLRLPDPSERKKEWGPAAQIETLRDLQPPLVRRALLNSLGTAGYAVLLGLTDEELAPAAEEVMLVENDACYMERARHIQVDFRGGFRGRLPHPIPYLVDLAEAKAMPEHLIVLLQAVVKDLASGGKSWQHAQALDTSSFVVAVEKFVPGPNASTPGEARSWLSAALGQDLLQNLIDIAPDTLRFIADYVVEFEGFKTQAWYSSSTRGPRVLPAPTANVPALILYIAQAISEQRGTEMLTNLLPFLFADLEARRSTWTAVLVFQWPGFWFREEINRELAQAPPSSLVAWFADRAHIRQSWPKIPSAKWPELAKEITRRRQAEIREQESSPAGWKSPNAPGTEMLPPNLLFAFADALPGVLKGT